MAIWTSETAASATQGKAQGQWQAGKLVIDSRAIRAGDLFVALPGERVDGHDFVADALEKGAAAAMVTRVPKGCENAPLLIVDDGQRALERLAAHNRAQTKANIVGVTGSVGKTSAKEALAIALAAHGETFASHGNFNNHLGTPLNLANLSKTAKHAVFEMGMNHAGEISQLTRQVRPHVALITNVEAVHLEFFASVEGIADAKAEIFEGVTENGAAVLNLDNPHVERLKTAALKRGIKRIFTFGEAANADFRLIHYTPSLKGAEVTLMTPQGEIAFAIGAVGRHFALTSASALACVHALGLDIRASARALAAFAEPEGRGRLSAIAVGGGDATLIDDSYNASPASMRSGLTRLKDIADATAPARRVAILGDMRELGETAPELHQSLLEPLKAAGVDTVFAAGPLMRHLFDALPASMRGAHAISADELLPLLQKQLREGDLILIKGSHGSLMYMLAEQLKSRRHPERSEGSSPRLQQRQQDPSLRSG